jgi:hypothetical protein
LEESGDLLDGLRSKVAWWFDRLCLDKLDIESELAVMRAYLAFASTEPFFSEFRSFLASFFIDADADWTY